MTDDSHILHSREFFFSVFVAILLVTTCDFYLSYMAVMVVCRFNWNQIIIFYSASIVPRLAGGLGDVRAVLSSAVANNARFRCCSVASECQQFQQCSFVIRPIELVEF